MTQSVNELRESNAARPIQVAAILTTPAPSATDTWKEKHIPENIQELTLFKDVVNLKLVQGVLRVYWATVYFFLNFHAFWNDRID